VVPDLVRYLYSRVIDRTLQRKIGLS